MRRLDRLTDLPDTYRFHDCAVIKAGTWVSDYDTQIYPRLQILSAQDLIDGKLPRMPASRTALFAEAKRERSREGVQGRLG